MFTLLADEHEPAVTIRFEDVPRFALDRVETIVDLCLRGFDLTHDEIDLLCRTDAGVWFLRSAVRGAPQH